MRFLRIALAISALLVVICVLAMAALLFFADPNRLKPMIVAEVMKKTGYQLLIDGNLSWSFYPKFSVKADKMSLKHPEETIPFINLYNVAIASSPSQFLSGQQTLQGDVTIGKVEFMRITAKKVRIGIHWQSPMITLQPLTAALYDGMASGVVRGERLTEIPRWNADVQFDKINMKNLLQDLNGADKKISLSGFGDVTLQISTYGTTRKQLFSNLNGATRFNLKNGAIEGIDLNYFLRTADAFIHSEPTDTIANTNQTAFGNLTGSAFIKNGVADTNDLLLTSPLFVAKATGVIDLTNQMLDYQLQIIPMRPGKIKWAVPLLVSGDLRNPNVHLDKLKLETLIARDQLEEAKTKLQDEVKQLPAKADQFLKKLMGN